MVREIPSLSLLCLRAVGSHDCNAQVTFREQDGETSSASKLLSAFHRRPVQGKDTASAAKDGVDCVFLARIPLVGSKTVRRAHANDVDMNLPVIAALANDKETTPPLLVMQYGNPALDCLQSYIDSLVELGRMDDSRLGNEFFQEWKRCCAPAKSGALEKSKKRKRTSPLVLPDTCTSSLSLHNCSVSDRTFSAMVSTKVGMYLKVLDLTGIPTLTDDLLKTLLPTCCQLQRLSVKNCRRITPTSLSHVATHCSSTLTSMDMGGSFNILPRHVLDDFLPNMPNLVELNASGLGWTDDTLLELVSSFDNTWQCLSLGFSMAVTTLGLQKALPYTSLSLQRLAIPFCESAVDNAFLGFLGKTLPLLQVLDIRGNSNVNSLTNFYDGRHAALSENRGGDKKYDLFVLARYTGMSNASLEETRRIHPLHTSELTCVLDGGGVGLGIRRVDSEKS